MKKKIEIVDEEYLKCQMKDIAWEQQLQKKMFTETKKKEQKTEWENKLCNWLCSSYYMLWGNFT